MHASVRGDAREASFRGIAVSPFPLHTHARDCYESRCVAEMRIRTLEVIFIIRCH